MTPNADLPLGWRHRRLALREVTLHAVEAGEGPLVLLLHGFPEFWYAWRHQIPALVDLGFRVVAVDQRGYGLSDKPPGIRAYTYHRLSDDAVQVLDAYEAQDAVVIGHDWGGSVTWALGMKAPERVRRMVILNAPHPVALWRGFLGSTQALRSLHMLVFQLPGLPEWLFRAHDYALLRAVFRRQPVRDNAFTQADIERYIRALDQPGALTAALNYYRALRHTPFWTNARTARPIHVPVLSMWGTRDPFLGPRIRIPPRTWVPQLTSVMLEDASHWLHVDQPEAVNRHLAEFLMPEINASIRV